MTYAIGQTIRAAEYNGIINGGTTLVLGAGNQVNAGVNGLWNDGTAGTLTPPAALTLPASYGYGQPVLPIVSTGNRIRAGTTSPISAPAEWRDMVNIVNDISIHQAGGAAPLTAANFVASASLPTATTTASGLVTFGNGLISAINSLTTTRFNANLSGTTVTSTGIRTTAWGGPVHPGPAPASITVTGTLTLSTSARYFFNSGGLLKVSLPTGTPSTTQDTVWVNFCAAVGTITFSAINQTKTIAGITYPTGFCYNNGTAPVIGTITNANGYHNGAGAAYSATYNSGSYSGEQISITVTAVTATTVSVQFTFTNGTSTWSPYYDQVSANLIRAQLTAVPPSTAVLANSWGTPTVNVPNF